MPARPMTPPSPPRAAEFFAGIGLVRLGLEAAGFHVTWSNDIEPAKHQMYAGHFGAGGDHEFHLGDVAAVTGGDLPSELDLAWASFPCTDLSLAGQRRGLGGAQSSTFWHFTRVLSELGDRRPPVLALENVVGLATSRGGADLVAAIAELNTVGYSIDVLAMDARRFVPQSRPRLFLIGALDPPPSDDTARPDCALRPQWLQWIYSDPSLRTHRAALPDPPPALTTGLSDIAERMPDDDARWWNLQRTIDFFASLSPLQLARVQQLTARRGDTYRTAYRRTRHGQPVWEVRADGIAGCLRTARGGSSKQAVVRLGRGERAVRWMTPREYARLMGAPDYCLDGLRPNQAQGGFGDAVCVPVVHWLGANYLMPLVARGATADPDRARATG